MRNLIYSIQALVLTPLLLMYLIITQQDTQGVIREDFKAWCQYKSRKYSWFQFLKLFAEYPEFRSVVYTRLKHKRFFISWLFKGQTSLYINNNQPIGLGLLIQHGFSTIINHKSIGCNCKIYQQVTIGYKDSKTPILGNNVTVCCGAKVIGDVTIGNDVIIGANAVVTKDIPDHCIVAGVPAVIIKRRNTIDEEWVKA